MNQISVNFKEVTGKVKPLHSVCCAPYSRGMGDNQRHIEKYFTEGNIPYCRLHDCCGAYGGSYFIDITNVFPDFDADEMNPKNYDFHYSDEYITAIQKTGCEAYYRLGETIEWGSKKYTAHPPKDFKKWARICEHIIMHYNKGWADGFHYNMKYWEIWNEPENPGDSWGKSQWTGTKEEFFELYQVASKHLKARFPKIKIGGYGSCGFYTLTKDDVPESFHDFVTWFVDFLSFVKKNNCPLDFYSWHIYTSDEKELLTHAKYVRETLDEHGFTDTEAHLNEWNIQAEGTGFKEKHNMEGGSFNAAIMCMLQNTHYVDIAMYYCFSLLARYNGFMDLNDGTIEPTWYPYVAFGQLYRLGNAVEVKTETNGVYATAAKSENEYGILISNYRSDDDKVQLYVEGIEGDKTAHVLYIDEEHSLEEEFSFTIASESSINIRLPKHTVVYVSIDSK